MAQVFDLEAILTNDYEYPIDVNSITDDNNSGIDISDINNADATGIAPGDYPFSFTAFQGTSCEANYTKIVRVNESAVLVVATDVTICHGESANVTANVTGKTGQTVLGQFSGNNGLPTSSTGQSTYNEAVNPTNTTTYEVSFDPDNEHACDNSPQSMTVTVNPEVSAGDDHAFSICEGDTNYNAYDLASGFANDVVPTGATVEYLDSGDNAISQSQNFAALSEGTYTFKRKVSNTVNGLTCTDESILTLTVQDKPESLVSGEVFNVCN